MRLLFVLLLSATLFAGEWTINDFTVRGKQFTQSATGILQGNLNRIPSYRAPKGDELLLRRRLDMNNYGLYIGKAEASAYTNLSRFTKPAGMSMDKLLKMKFFKDETPMGYNDVADIYFQGEYIYVKNLVRIFYKENGSWKSLEVAQGEKPGVLEISSTPSGATVTIDGVIKGKTPYSFVMDAPTVEVEVSKSGYYSQSFTADAKPGAVKKLSSILNKEIAISAIKDPNGFVDTSLTDIGEAEALAKAINKAKTVALAKEKDQLANFERTYPKLKPRDEFEYPEEFNVRKAAYDKEKSQKRKKYQVDEALFNHAFYLMELHIEKLDSKLYSLYLPVNSLKLGKYDIYKLEFPVTIKINQGPFDFSFSGKLPIPRDAARKFKFSSAEKGLKVTYGKRQVEAYVNGKKLKKYIKYSKLVLPFEGKEYELIGEVKLPDAIAQDEFVRSYLAYQKEKKSAEIARVEAETLRKKEEELKRQYEEEQRREKARLEQQRLEKQRIERAQRYNGNIFKAMKKVPGGKFKMGTNAKNNSARPSHKVELSSFWMDSTEVTVDEFTRLMGDEKVNSIKRYFNTYVSGKHPITLVSWYDALLYCNERSKEAGLDTVYSYSEYDVTSNVYTHFNRNGYRLPTEAEWEYAFGEYRSYDPYTYAVCGTNGQRGIRSKYGQWYYGVKRVASKSPNNYGLYDMAGNAREWCNDLYNAKYYSVSPKVNPRGPSVSNTTARVIRGGAWNSRTSKQQVRTSGYSYNVETNQFTRSSLTPSKKTGRNYWGSSSTKDGYFLNISFRCVLPFQESN